MKTSLLTIAVLLTVAGFGVAGPEPISSSKETKNVVQMTPPPCPSWTGFYVGGLVGYKYGVIDTDLDLGGAWDEFPDERDFIEDHGDRDFSTSGAELGGLIGFNYQWHNWVFGVEAAGGYLWLRDSDSRTFFVDGAVDEDVRVSGSFKTHYLFTLGGKLGYAFCRWLPYITGGLSVGDSDFDGQILFQDDEGFRFQRSNSDTHCGWFIGGGLEYMLTNHWRLRAQYQYIDLGSVGIGVEDNFDEGFTSHRDANLREHNAQFAVIYGF